MLLLALGLRPTLLLLSLLELLLPVLVVLVLLVWIGLES
jgi:hypothetical protein